MPTPPPLQQQQKPINTFQLISYDTPPPPLLQQQKPTNTFQLITYDASPTAYNLMSKFLCQSIAELYRLNSTSNLY